MKPLLTRAHVVLSALTLIAVLLLGYRQLQLDRQQSVLQNQLTQLNQEQAKLSAQETPIAEQIPERHYPVSTVDQRLAKLEKDVETLSKSSTSSADGNTLHSQLKELVVSGPPYHEASGAQRGYHGQIRFIRLEYDGGDWNQDMGVGCDLNMLREYSVRTKMRVAQETESRTIFRLNNFKPDSAPPFVYLTGQKNIELSKEEVEILRAYLLEKGGMIFGDNGGSAHFHEQFLAMMRRVLPDIEPVIVPLDDPIHRRPYPIFRLPYVALHGGQNALGWKDTKLDRWLCYYHPGDLGDAWNDDHAGVDKNITELCYQLGVNVIFYACAQRNKHVLRLNNPPPADLSPEEVLDNLLD